MNFGELLRHMKEQNKSFGVAKEARMDITFTKLFMKVFNVDKREDVNYVNRNGLSNDEATGNGYEVIFEDASCWKHLFLYNGKTIAVGKADINTLDGQFVIIEKRTPRRVVEVRFSSVAEDWENGAR